MYIILYTVVSVRILFYTMKFLFNSEILIIGNRTGYIDQCIYFSLPSPKHFSSAKLENRNLAKKKERTDKLNKEQETLCAPAKSLIEEY